MQQVELSRLAQEAPLRVLLVHAGEPDSLTWSGLVQPLRLAAKVLGPERLHVDVRTPDKFAADQRHWHLVLLVADEAEAGLRPANLRTVISRCRAASPRARTVRSTSASAPPTRHRTSARSSA